MPWYSPWSDHIAKSVCKYLLQRYLGKFLEEKLTLDQLTVDLFKGIGVISDVALDVQELNKVAEEQNIPFEFTDGFIEKMSVSVPWSSILNDATNIQVEGLSLTIKKTERDKTRVSMFESMWSSMTSSMQLAEDCLKSERDNPNEEGGQAFEGVERFAHTIDSILSKIKVKFLRTVICLEEVPNNSSTGIAFEISINLMGYFDEAAVSEATEGIKQDFHLLAFSTKKIYLEGVTLYSDEFPVSVVTNSKISLTDDNSCEQEENLISNEEESTKVVIGRFAGKQEVTIRIKQEGVDGPKIDLQFSLGPLTFFASPHQIHNLLELINGMTTSSQNSRNNVKNQCSQKPMEESDFRMIERELQMNFNNVTTFQPKGLGNQGWASTCLDGSEEEFSPLNNSCRLNDSVISSNSSLSSSVMSVSSRSSHCQGQTCILQPKRNHSGNREIDSNAVVFHFHVKLNSLNVVFLHEDILTACVDSHQSTIAKSSFEEMRRLADEFFERLEHAVGSGYGNKDLEKVRDVFLKACQLNHIRFTAAPIIVEGSETSTTHTSVIKGKCTASGLEIIECLLEKEVNSQKCNVEYVEVRDVQYDVLDLPESSVRFQNNTNV